MKPIDRAKNHFESKEIKVIEVPEWADDNGQPLKIFAKPLTLAETSKLYKMSKEDDLTMMAYVLIYKALDDNGDKMFELSDKMSLLHNVDRRSLSKDSNRYNGFSFCGGSKKKLLEDSELFAQYALADRLGKTLSELQEITIREFNGWMAYLEVLQEKHNGKK